MTKPQPTIDLGYPTEATGPFPSFNNIEEEAEWWDTHDAEGNLIDEEDTLTVYLSESTHSKLVRLAERRGIEPSTLVRMWVKEHLEEEAAREAKAS